MAYTVNRTLLTWIQLRDGTKLAGKLWMPELVNNDKCAEDETYPAILGENLYPLTEFCGSFVHRFSEGGKTFNQ